MSANPQRNHRIPNILGMLASAIKALGETPDVSVKELKEEDKLIEKQVKEIEKANNSKRFKELLAEVTYDGTDAKGKKAKKTAYVNKAIANKINSDELKVKKGKTIAKVESSGEREI